MSAPAASHCPPSISIQSPVNRDLDHTVAGRPEAVLDALAPYAAVAGADGPIHRLKLERRKVIEVAAADHKARPVAELLEEIGGSRLPENVRAELSSWTQHGEKVTFYEAMGLLELPRRGSPPAGASACRCRPRPQTSLSRRATGCDRDRGPGGAAPRPCGARPP